MNNLYKAEVTVDMYFYQDHEPLNYEIGEVIEQEARYLVDSVEITKIESINEVPDDWQNSIPYGNTDSKIKDLLQE